MPDRCPVCDRPRAAAADWTRLDDHSGCECPECVAVCWGADDCEARAVDWRARALAAEALCRDLARLGTGALRHDYQGGCPDEVEGLDVRDPECPACRVLMAADGVGIPDAR